MRKVLLFGASGFIGKNLVESLKNNRHFSVTSLTKKDCNLLKAEEILRIINKSLPDFIINAAYIGVNSNIDFHEDYLFENLKITANILKASAENEKLKKVLFFGSGLEYGDSSIPISEDKALQPQNIYAGIKAANSILAQSLAKHWEVPLVILKPFNLYGPHDTKSVVYLLVNTIKQDRKAVLTAGEQVRDYLYIEDFCELIIKILEDHENLRNFETYNIGSGKPIKLKNVFDTIFKIMGAGTKYKTRPYRANDYMYQVADIKKIQGKISWKPKTDIEEGLKKTIEWIMYKGENPIYNSRI